MPRLSETTKDVIGKPRELKHLSTWRKREQLVIPQVVASERGKALKYVYNE